jgi:hypothetical protein
MNKTSISLNEQAQKIYNSQSNKSEFLNNLIVDYLNKSKAEISEISNLNKTLEAILSNIEILKSEQEQFRKDIVNILFMTSTDEQKITIKNYFNLNNKETNHETESKKS